MKLSMFWIQITATVCGFMCVVLTIRRNIWCWPVGLAQVLLFIVIFYDARLYSDLLLHIVYVGLQLYGWSCWGTRSTAESTSQLIVETLQPATLCWWIAGTAGATLALGHTMETWTNAAVPYADAFTTSASLTAQYLLAHRRLENWLFWIVVDVVAIGVYVHKDLIPTAVLYSLFLVLAMIGYVCWRKRLRVQLSLADFVT
jgi:nicotinamide mononucleotide transporter